MLLTEYRAKLIEQTEAKGPEELSSDQETAIRQIALWGALAWYEESLDTNDNLYDPSSQDLMTIVRPMLLRHQGTHAKWVGRRCSVATALLEARHDPKDYEGHGSCCRLLCPACAIYRNFRLRAALLLAPPGYLYLRFMGHISFALPWSPLQLKEWKVDRRQLSLVGWCEHVDDSQVPDADGDRHTITTRFREGYWWAPSPDVTGVSSLPENAEAVEQPNTQIDRSYEPEPEQQGDVVRLIGGQGAVTMNGPEELVHELTCTFDASTGTGHPIILARHPLLRLHHWQTSVLVAENFKTRNCRFASKPLGQ